MSNLSNRNEMKSPNPKLARYLQRIEQLVGHRNRTPSPLASRSPRPLKANSLDHYLKFELTFKILCNFADKKNKSCMRYLFNLLRNKYDHEQTKVEKIYKFVPIEKTQCTHMIIDTGISIKMLTNILKTLYKSNLKHAFSCMKPLILTDSQLMSINTARSNKSNLTPLSGSQIFTYKKPHTIALVLYKMHMLREMGAFDRIKNYRNQPNNRNSALPKSNFQITVNKYINLDMVKLCFLGSLFDKIKMKNVQGGFYRIDGYGRMLEHKQQKQNENENNLIDNCQTKISKLAEFLHYKNKTKIIQQVKYIARSLKDKIQKQQQEQEQEQESYCEDVEKVSAMVSTSTLSRLNSTLVYDGTNKINISIMSILMRRKLEFIRSLKKNNSDIVQGCALIVGVLGRKLQARLVESFIKIKYRYENRKSKLRKNGPTIWQKIGTIININKFFIYALKQPFNAIRDYSTNKIYVEQNIKTMEYYFNRNKIREGFENIKEYNERNRGNRTRSFMDPDRLPKQLELLPRILNKFVLLRYTEFFIKLKSSNKNKNKNNLKSSNANSSKTYMGWTSDIESFISERDRFNRNLTENYQKISSMIHTSNSKENYRQDTQSPIITRNNTSTNDEGPKVVFSPKNRNIKKVVFPN